VGTAVQRECAGVWGAEDFARRSGGSAGVAFPGSAKIRESRVHEEAGWDCEQAAQLHPASVKFFVAWNHRTGRMQLCVELF